MTRSGATRPAATSARRRVIVCSGATAKRVNWVMGFSQLWVSAGDGCSLTGQEQAQIRQQVCTPIGQKSDLYPGFEEKPCFPSNPLFARDRPPRYTGRS